MSSRMYDRIYWWNPFSTLLVLRTTARNIYSCFPLRFLINILCVCLIKLPLAIHNYRNFFVSQITQEACVNCKLGVLLMNYIVGKLALEKQHFHFDDISEAFIVINHWRRNLCLLVHWRLMRQNYKEDTVPKRTHILFYFYLILIVFKYSRHIML